MKDDKTASKNRRSLIIALRELNPAETELFCRNASSIASPPITNQTSPFISNYRMRLFATSCYYLDERNQWRSDGLDVGSNSDLFQTECFSTHLTTFTTGLVFLPQPIRWDYVFDRADFLQNKTIYLTVIVTLLIYLLLILFAAYHDRKDHRQVHRSPLLPLKSLSLSL